MKKHFKTIGKVMFTEEIAYTFFLDNEGSVYLHNDPDTFLADPVANQYVITRFVSRTIFYGPLQAISFKFNTGEEQELKQFLDQHFPKKDESLIKFIRFIEGKSALSDIEKFSRCERIIRRVALQKLGVGYIANPNTDKWYYLVEADIPVSDSEFSGNKIFLQTVQSVGEGRYYFDHQELTPELYFFSRCSEVVSAMEEVLE